MRYIKYSFMIMVVCLTLTIINSYAADTGRAYITNVRIDWLGSYKTSLYRKQTSNPQYAKKMSCYGVALGLDTVVSAKTDRYSVSEGEWTSLSQNQEDTKLKGNDTTKVEALYELNLKSTGTVESCNFVGNWAYN